MRHHKLFSIEIINQEKGMKLNLSASDKNIFHICCGLKISSETSFTVDYKDGVILVRGVPILVCS